jgi:hypothetical protein
MMLKSALAVAAGLPLSDTCTVKLEVPTLVVVPETTPVTAFRLRLVGKTPRVILHE